MKFKIRLLGPSTSSGRVGLVVGLLGCLVVGLLVVKAFALTGEQIINRLDENMTFKTARTEARMVIHVEGEVREKGLITYERGRDTAFAEFTAPARDQGVKYLMIKDNMWMYLPEVDKIIKIAGHMLRQSMMGSDFSYEDALESSKLLEKYSVTLVSEEVVPLTFRREGKLVAVPRRCYVLDLTAKVKEVTYYRRMTWVDKELFVPVKEELFAMSGKKLKVMTVGDVQKFGARYYPMYYTISNLLRKDSMTEMFITKAAFDIRVPEETFTQRNLRK